jgi:hypothetical protein
MDTPYYMKTERKLSDHPDLGITQYIVARSGHEDLCSCDERWKAQKIIDALNSFEREGR